MKKFFTLCFSLLMGCAALNAQVIGGNVDETFQFTDAEGNVIPNGTRYIANEVEVEEIMPGYVSTSINSGVYIKNVSDGAGFATMTCKLVSATNGQVSVCWPTHCRYLENVGEVFETESSLVQSGTSQDIQAHFQLNADVTSADAELELQIVRHNIVMDNYGQPAAGDESYLGSKITLKFTTDQTAGITDATVAESNEVVARYTLDGRAIDAPQKGVNIVKYADGRTVKVVVK